MNGHVGYRTDGGSVASWNTLDELRAVALAQGCTLAQFANAVETVGPELNDVANYLQRRAFIASPQSSKSGIA